MRKPESMVLRLSLPSDALPATAAVEKRQISGLALPYGPVGNSSLGAIRFQQGSLTWSETGRVKLLKQHDPERVLGFATEIEDTPEGLYTTFSVPDSPEGDTALLEAEDGRRDGLSVGVLLDEDSLSRIVEKWMEGDASPTDVSGELLEVSQVSIPAFRDARTDGSAAKASLSGHVTLAVEFGNHIKEHVMTDVAEQTVKAAETLATPEAAPAAIAGAAVTQTEAPVYTFDGNGPSFVRDIFHARFSLDMEAQARLARFNSMMTAGDVSQTSMVTAAVETRSTHPKYIENGYRPDMLIRVIDEGRPLTSRIGTVTLTDATPFRVPVDGKFSGVADHTEGTSHATEGALVTGDVTFTPGAISGAYRISRELVDAANPALDTIALRAMVRDYRSVSEGKVAAALATADSVADVSVSTVMKVRAAINSYYDTNLENPSFIAASTGFYSAIAADVDGSGRPMLASVAPQNAAGSASGSTGAYVDGVELVKAGKVSVNDAFLLNTQDILIGESALRTFRFDEVEGPGIIKLALWAYFGALVTRTASVVKITSAATD